MQTDKQPWCPVRGVGAEKAQETKKGREEKGKEKRRINDMHEEVNSKHAKGQTALSEAWTKLQSVENPEVLSTTQTSECMREYIHTTCTRECIHI